MIFYIVGFHWTPTLWLCQLILPLGKVLCLPQHFFKITMTANGRKRCKRDYSDTPDHFLWRFGAAKKKLRMGLKKTLVRLGLKVLKSYCVSCSEFPKTHSWGTMITTTIGLVIRSNFPYCVIVALTLKWSRYFSLPLVVKRGS